MEEKADPGSPLSTNSNGLMMLYLEKTKPFVPLLVHFNFFSACTLYFVVKKYKAKMYYYCHYVTVSSLKFNV